MTGIFKANNPSGNLFLFLYAIVLKAPLFLNSSKAHLQPLDGVLYKSLLILLDPISNSFQPTFGILAFILFFLQAVGINKIVNNQRLLKQNNYLAGMSYLLATSLFTEWFSFSAPLIVNTCMIWAFTTLCSLYNNQSPKTAIFNIGVAVGISSFIYFPSITFLVLVIVGITISRPFKLQEWLTVLLGIITPVYLFIGYLFLFDKINTYHFPGFHLSSPSFFQNKWAYAAVATIVITILIGLYFINTNFNRQVVQTRKSWQLFFLYFIVAALMPFFNASINFSYWILLAVPAAPIMASAFFYPKKKYIPLLLYWSMFAIFIARGFMNK